MSPLQPPDAETEGRLRQFNRLILSYRDFKHAKLAAAYILAEHLHAKYPDESYVTLPALNASMILAYCRPFSGNAKRLPDLPGRFLRVLSEAEREIHETVLFDRNRLLAHSDAEALNPEPVRLRIADDREVLVPLKNWGLAPLTEEATGVFLSAATKLFDATFLERCQLEKDLMPYFRTVTPDTLFENGE
jgi:hypothetical protein